MSEAARQKWRDALRGQGIDDLLDNLTLKKVAVRTESGTVCAYFSSTIMIEAERLTALKRRLTTILGGENRVDIKIDFEQGADSLKANFSACSNELAQRLAQIVPSMKPMLPKLVWELVGGDKLVIKTEDRIVCDLFERKSCAKVLENQIFTQYGQRIHVDIVLDDHAAEDIHAKVAMLNRQQDILEAVAAEVENASQPIVETTASLKQPEKRRFSRKKDANTILGYTIDGDIIPISSITERSGDVVVEGQIIAFEARDTKSGKKQILKLSVFDGTSAIMLKAFVPVETCIEHQDDMKPGAWVRAKGVCSYDPYDRDILITLSDLNKAQARMRRDDAADKRVELHAHTKMSLLDAVTPVKALINQAKSWGHDAIAITDHGVVQAFPEAFDATEKDDFKVILGMEGYLVDTPEVVLRPGKPDWTQDYVVFDVETTGLNAYKDDRLTEIGAVRLSDGKVTDRFSSFINPRRMIPQEIQKLTGITDEMVAAAPDAGDVLRQFREFVGDTMLVAHNASFDIGFLLAEGKRQAIDYQACPVLDTLAFARLLFPTLKSHRLNTLAKHLKVPLYQHHRAQSDAETTAGLLIKMIDAALVEGVENMDQITEKLSQTVVGGHDYHVILLARNQEGLRNLYRMVTLSHLEYFYRRPRIPRKVLEQHREGLWVGSACEAGDLFTAVLAGKDRDELLSIADFYDYLEVQPIGNNAFLIREGQVKDQEALRDFNRIIISLGEELGKPVVATGDVHFLDPGDEVYRRILFSGQKFTDADAQPPLYLRTTQEMLEEFSYLGGIKAREIVIDAPRRIAAACDKIRPFPKETYHPSIPGAEDMVRNGSIDRATLWYGDPLPETVQARLDKELKSIIGHGFSALYLTASRLVKKSLSDGYLVGSRGSVGSSLVATFMGITEVNPLPSHYRCPECRYTDFQVDHEQFQCGVDLPDRQCPRCGVNLRKEGYDIPFEVFLGFDGDKVPDIDLNFSGVYQAVAHKYTEELFGAGNVFRAGTISGLAEKTAFGYVNGYLSDTGRTANKAEVARLVAGITGVKRTTGQHPGGIVVVPKEIDVELFTPLQHPADDRASGIITTHFDFNSLHDRLVKLDILGHDDPTIIRMLEDTTKIDPLGIPLTDPNVISLFQSPAALGVTPEDLDGCPTGTLGIPEFGTEFVRQMLVETKPKCMADLIRISGLSHGTNVWNSNAQDLIADGVATMPECICTREDIMTRLIQYGLDFKLAFNTMERVRKGKGLTDDMVTAMMDNDVPDWFIGSCQKISYLFPKGHAAAYVMMAVRIAWFKVYHPKAYYATYLTVRAGDAFDISLMGGGREAVKKHLTTYKVHRKEATKKDQDILMVLEIVLEMNSRGINFDPVDIQCSEAMQFVITDTGLLPPMRSIPGMGETAALSIAEARKDGAFRSLEDLINRTRVNKTQLQELVDQGCLRDLPQNDQISMF